MLSDLSGNPLLRPIVVKGTFTQVRRPLFTTSLAAWAYGKEFHAHEAAHSLVALAAS